MNISEDTRRKFPNYVFLCDAYQLRSQEDIDQIVKKVNDGELLCAASIEGHLDIVKMLLNKPYNVNPNEEYEKELKKTPLLHACRNGHSVVAELLIDKGANVNSRDWDGYTPLRWAVSEGLSEVCLQLIYKGADLEGKKVSHDTRRILSIACRNGLYDVAKLMIEKGANVNTPDWGYADQRETPFYRACLHNHDKVALLLVQNGVTVNKTFKGQSPLLLACSYGFGDVALELIERNATIDFKFNYDGSTPFYRSCQKGLYDVVVTLINKGIHIDEVDGSGNSSFSAACANGHINIVKLLISKNIISDPIKQLLRPLKFACEGGHADVVSTLLDVEKTIVNYAKDFVFSAVKRGHIDVVKILIQNGISLNSIDMIGYTLLMHACVCDKADVAVFLIKSGAEVNTKGMNGASPLSLAADKGLTEVVELLIEKNVDINETSRMQKTALHLACESRGATGVLRVLIKAKASLDVIDSKGYTPLMRACYNGNNDAAVILLEAGANAKIGDNALSLLLFAANSRQELLNTVELLIKKGVDLEVKDSEGRTPLYSACEKNFSDVALLLIENGASVNVENENEGITLLLLVCRAGLTDVAKVLVTKGVELEDYDKYGRTALLMACHNGHSDEIATFLINHKADVHATDRMQKTALHHACERGATDVIRALIKANASLDAIDSAGYTPLFCACQNGKYDAAVILLEAGANANVTNKEGLTALLIACRNGHSEIAKYLIHHKADIYATDTSCSNSLLYACKSGLNDVALLLIEQMGPLDKEDENIKQSLNFANQLKLLDVEKALIQNIKSSLKFANEFNLQNVKKEIIKASEKSSVTSGPVETVPVTTNKPEHISKEDLFASFRRKSSHKDRAIDLIRRYNKPETPLKDLVDTKEHNCKSLLQWASIRGWSDVCELLIRDHQCDPLYEDENNWTVLHNVCRNGHFDLVRYYVSKPFFMDHLKKNKQGTTPLDYSIDHGHTDITDYLKSIIGHVNNPSMASSELFEYFRQKTSNKAKGIELLRQYNDSGIAIKDLVDTKKQKSLLQRACILRWFDVWDLLITEYQCDPRYHRDVNGDTVLHTACYCGHIDLVRLLVSKPWSMDPLQKNKDGLTPLSFSEESGHSNITKYLKSIVDNRFLGLREATDSNSAKPKEPKTDYLPYLEEAAKRGTVKSKRTSIGIFGASGTGKTSILRLLLNQPPVYQHDSTPVARPLKGTWMISLGDKRWIQAAPDTLHAAIANSVKDMKNDQQNIEQSPSNCDPKSPISKKRKIDPTDKPSPPSQTSASSQSTSPFQTNHVSILNLPATKLVAEILDSGKDLEGFHFVNITDSGGQAPFIDIAPALIPHNSLNLVVFKLNENLNAIITFNYSIKGKLVGSEKRNITTEQLIAATVSSKTKMHKSSECIEKPLFMVLGTYYDIYKRDETYLEKLTEKNDRLNVVLKDFEDVVIPNGDDIIFPLNALSRNDGTQKMAEKIHNFTSKCYTEIDVPITWYLFQIAIEELKASGEEMILFPEFVQIGKYRNMNEAEVKAALHYLHDLNVCLYYPEILPQVVFTSPQYLFDKISELIAVSLNESQEDIMLVRMARKKLKNSGIITKDLLKKLPSKFLDEQFSTDDFLKLMHHLHIVAPLSEPDTYFMPCLLETIDDPIQHLDVAVIEPLLLSWNSTVPHGLFTSLVSWLHDSQFEIAKSEQQHRNRITFNCPKLACQIIIFEYPAFIGLANTCSHDTSKKSASIFKIVQEGIGLIVKDFKWLDAVAYPQIAYLCKIPECKLKHPHLCYLDNEQKYISCSENCSLTMKQLNAHLVWFEQKDSPNFISQSKDKFGDKMATELDLKTSAKFQNLQDQLKMEREMKMKAMAELEQIKTLQKLNDPVNITKTVSDIGIQFDFSIPVADDYIQGAFIAGRMSYTIQGNKPQTLHWDDYGLKMYFPRDTLQHDDNCEVAILALAGGNFHFPKGTELVSAVYAITFQKKINQRVGIDIEHCVALATERQITQLHFVATEKGDSQKENVFEFIEGGQFQIGSKYGYMEQMHFCKKGIVKDSEDGSSTESNDKVQSNVYYIGFLLYETKTFNHHWLMQFFVYKDIKVYEKFIETKCDKSEIDQRFCFTFTDSCIELTLSDPVPDGWMLHPHNKPLKLRKSDIDHFGPCPISPPSCMITIYRTDTPNEAEPLHYPITLVGINSSVEEMFIIRSRSIDEITPATASGSPPSSQQSAPNTHYATSTADPNTVLVSTIRDVFNNNVARLNSLLQSEDIIKKFAMELLQEQLISDAVSRNPEYRTVVDNFLSTLLFMTERSQIEQQCSKFLKVLHNIGGQFPSEYMKKQLVDAAKTRLKIDLHLDNTQ